MKVSVRYFIILSIFFLTGNGQDINNNSMVTVTLPKCCESNTQAWKTTMCDEIFYKSSLDTFKYYTYKNNDDIENKRKKKFKPKFRTQPPCTANVIILKSSLIFGFTPNGSIILNTKGDREIKTSLQYCIDPRPKHKIAVLLYGDNCYNSAMTTPKTVHKLTIPQGDIYFACIVFSTVCYFFAVFIYYFVLNVQEGHKKCFIGYSLTMGMTFLFLILLQKINIYCEYLGSTFFVLIIASFVWLYCICLDMVYIIRNFKHEDASGRIFLYVSASILIPTSMLLVSILPTGMPDVPDAFLKRLGMCKFKEGQTRISVLFIPIILLLLSSIGSLIYAMYKISVNEKIYKCDINWLKKHSQFTYMIRSCSIIVLMSLIWIVDAVVENALFENSLVYAFIEGSQGILLIAIFVFNRYTRKEIYNAFVDKKRKTVNSKRFQTLLQKFKRQTHSSHSKHTDMETIVE